MSNIIAQQFLKELESEAAATRKCLERVPSSLYDWKPHEKSMKLGYLAHLVAEIPEWIRMIIEEGTIDLGTMEHFQAKSPEELAAFFDRNMEGARKALSATSDEGLQEKFELKMNGQLLVADLKGDTVFSSINHGVHHRGQLSVYLRLNNIPVPSLYGPSADDKTF